MRVTAEFTNNVFSASAILPTLVASVASTLMIGPSALIAPVIFGSLYFISRNSLGHSTVSLSSLEQIEHSQAIEKITKNMGFEKPPNMFVIKEQKKITARASFNNVLMAESLLQRFDKSEEDFIWAHEFAHVKRGDNKVTSSVYSNVSTSSLSFLTIASLSLTKDMASQGDLLMASSSFALAAVVSSVPLLIKGTRASNHIAEFDCDKRAVLATGNIDAGIRALKKLNTKRYARHATSTHPCMNLRIRALEALKVGTEEHTKVVQEALKARGNDVSAYNPAAATLS